MWCLLFYIFTGGMIKCHIFKDILEREGVQVI